MRQLLLTIKCLLVLMVAAPDVCAQETVRLWQNSRVHARGVTLRAFVPEDGGRRTAVIVCPGGSYCWLDYKKEGTDVARWLSDNGIVAFVLKYRVQGKLEYASHSRAIFGGHRHPDMITDVQRAIQYVREHAVEYGIDPDRVGVMGFSAGGHLAMSAAAYHHSDFLRVTGRVAGIDATDPGLCHRHLSLRPDFVAPIYPVVTMSHPSVHKRSRRALLGEYGKFSHALRDSLSLEQHVPEDCPPVFLVNCKDDPVVKCRNSELLDSALSARNIPHRYIQYRTGGHGFGVSETKGTPESREWKNEFLVWMKENGF